MPRFKLLIEYDGTPFVGWQAQDNGVSVQSAIAAAVTAFSGETVPVHGAGRTDAGGRRNPFLICVESISSSASVRLSVLRCMPSSSAALH